MRLISDPYKEALKVVHPAIAQADFHIFVLGPGLAPNETVKRPRTKIANHESILKHARYLRYATKVELEGKNYSVEFGETKEMYEFWMKHFGAPDPGSAELLQARNMCGAIIVYPSSIGSICELGMFATDDRISEKTFALVHKSFENDDSFFRKALLEVFSQENGKYVFVDYSNHSSCVAEALKFVNGKYSKLLRDYYQIETARQKMEKLRGTIYQKSI